MSPQRTTGFIEWSSGLVTNRGSSTLALVSSSTPTLAYLLTLLVPTLAYLLALPSFAYLLTLPTLAYLLTLHTLAYLLTLHTLAFSPYLTRSHSLTRTLTPSATPHDLFATPPTAKLLQLRAGQYLQGLRAWARGYAEEKVRGKMIILFTENLRRKPATTLKEANTSNPHTRALSNAKRQLSSVDMRVRADIIKLPHATQLTFTVTT